MPPRIVRKTPLLSKIKSYPYDLVLSWNERFQLVDWDDIAESYSVYTALVLNLVLVLCRLYIDLNTGPVYKTLKIKSTSTHSALLAFIETLYYSLITFSLVNFFVCMTSLKNYDLISRDINKVPNTSSLFKIQLDRPVAIEPDSSSNWTWRLCKFVFWKLYQRVFPAMNSNTSDQDPQQLTWRLAVWNPSLMQLHLSALFSPLNVAFVVLVSPIGLGHVVFLFLLSAYQYYLVVVKYETKLKDEFILTQNFLHEYNTKFVDPRLNRRYIDKSVDGWTGSVRLFYPDKRTKVFVTHNS